MHQACGSPPRLVNVVLFCENVPHEQLMCNELRRLGCAQGVRQLFVAMHPAVDGPRLVGDILYIPGTESMPSVQHKIVEAMRYCLQHIPFDVLVQSNISTVVDFTAITYPDVADTARADTAGADTAGADSTVLSRPAVEHFVLHADGARLYTANGVAIGDAPWRSNNSMPESADVLRMRKIVDRLVANAHLRDSSLLLG
jgi:hypothetical protein